jgi:D-alanine-D-alanine ligase
MTVLDSERARARLVDKRVGVVYGATSHEDALYMDQVPRSDWSATLIVAALESQGVAAVHLDPTDPDLIGRLHEVDLVFVNAHGPFGEDGRLQGLLEYLAKPYTFSGVSASSLGMDKLVTKAVFSQLGILTPKASPLLLPDTDVLASVPSFPVMVKAVDGGSSLGIELAFSAQDVTRAVDALRSEGFDRLFLEEYVKGRSVTLSVLSLVDGRVCLPPIEVISDNGDFYDAETKLTGNSSSETSYLVPIDLGESVFLAMERAALAFGDYSACRGAYRVDFVVSDGRPYALEVNTVPGLQRMSNLPVAARAAGIEYESMLLLLCEEALDSRAPLPWSGR